MSQIVMVARDAAPSNAFSTLGGTIASDGADVSLFLGGGGPLPASREYIAGRVKSANVILIGMSSPPNQARGEIAAARTAREAGVPFGFYADIYGAHKREPFGELLRDASFLFVMNDREAEDAQAMFPGVNVIPSGNPEWEKFFFPRHTREEIRQKLGVPSEERTILVLGEKLPALNFLMWHGIIEAVRHMNGDEPRVLIAPHPGDQTDLATYDDLLGRTSVSIEIISRDVLRTSEMLPGADLVIGFCSTVGIEAGCIGIPVIDYLVGEIAEQIMMEAFGSLKWEPWELGVAMKVSHGEVLSLTEAISRLLTPDGSAKMRTRQEEIYVKPTEKGATVRVMRETLLRFVN